MSRPAVCFVCLGNICRSPTAEGVFRHLLEAAELGAAIEVDSAGTGAWHVGERPDERSRTVAGWKGITVDGAARQFVASDFVRFDWVIALDRKNAADLRRLAPDDEAASKIRLLREFDPEAGRDLDVPDPYYGGPDGFQNVLAICERGCVGLLEAMRERHDL
ncbi:MAG: low molecular weight protein-tyrosine-phosphatase [Myxococcota bacterium]